MDLTSSIKDYVEVILINMSGKIVDISPLEILLGFLFTLATSNVQA